MITKSSEHEAEARENFDRWSESSTFRRLGPWLQFVQGEVMGMADWSAGTRVLDVACGSGIAVYISALRLAHKSESMACGCDISQGMLRKRARSGAPSNAYFVAGSAQSLPFSDCIFDTVFCTAAFHHFPKPLGALHEFRRILRPGGKVIIADTCRDQSVTTWIWDRLHRWFEKGHVMYYRRGELFRLLNEAGFVSIELNELSPPFREVHKVAAKVAIFCASAPAFSIGRSLSEQERFPATL